MNCAGASRNAFNLDLKLTGLCHQVLKRGSGSELTGAKQRPVARMGSAATNQQFVRQVGAALGVTASGPAATVGGFRMGLLVMIAVSAGTLPASWRYRTACMRHSRWM